MLTEEFRRFADRHMAVLQQLERECALAYWNACCSGRNEDFSRYADLQLKIERIYTNRDEFDLAKRAKASGKLRGEEICRIAELLYLRYLGNQVDPELLARIVELAARVEKKFGVYRPELEGRAITTNEVYRVLREENGQAKRRAVWEAQKSVGRVVRSDLLELVALRNEAARGIGFDNYYTMALALTEQNETELEAVFDELERMTREPFREMKRELDSELARRYGMDPDEIRPWHYHDPYFQEAPRNDDLDLDRYYDGADIVEIARRFYASIGIDVADVLTRSDLFERDGKNPHAFCTDIDRCGDIRVLANLEHNSYWMETMLHELGHAAYDKSIDPSLPYLLRKYPHLCLTEASAIFFGRLAQDPGWMRGALGISAAEAARIAPAIRRTLRRKELIFARWCQTMFHFERALYADPDRDLNALWWDAVERYQLVRRPEGRDEPDWAAKIHIVTNPVYYHNYMLGELIASQLHNYIETRLLGGEAGETGIYGSAAVGAYFRDVVFKPGNTLPWNAHIERATGEPLTARYFVEQFVKEPD